MLTHQSCSCSAAQQHQNCSSQHHDNRGSGSRGRQDPGLSSIELRKADQELRSGREGTEVSENFRPPMKGLGNSTTISFDVDIMKDARIVVLSLTEMGYIRLRLTGMCARLVSVSIRICDISGRGRGRKMEAATDSTMFIYETACQLLAKCCIVRARKKSSTLGSAYQTFPELISC